MDSIIVAWDGSLAQGLNTGSPVSYVTYNCEPYWMSLPILNFVCLYQCNFCGYYVYDGVHVGEVW